MVHTFDPEGHLRENLADVLKGEFKLPWMRELQVIDLGAISEDFLFESAGLHKRVRAGVHSLLARSWSNTSFDWRSEKVADGYADYDLVVNGRWVSFGGDWGDRGCIMQSLHSRHVSASGTLETGAGTLYAHGEGIVGIVTDSEGNPSVGFRFWRDTDTYDGAYHRMHREVHSLVEEAWVAAQGRMLLDLLNR